MKILVIEDKPQHLEEAKRIFTDKFKGEFVLDFATTYAEVKGKIQTNNYDGILSDVFLPIELDADDALTLKFGLIKAKAGYYGQTEEEVEQSMDFPNLFQDEMPYGVLIAKYALGKGIPIVLITDTYHHGEKTEPINIWSKDVNIPLVDRDVNEESLAEEGIKYPTGNPREPKNKAAYEKVKQHEFRKKDWFEGLLVLFWMMEGKKSEAVVITAEGISTGLAFGWAGSLLEAIDSPDKWESQGNEKNKEGFKEMVKAYLK